MTHFCVLSSERFFFLVLVVSSVSYKIVVRSGQVTERHPIESQSSLIPHPLENRSDVNTIENQSSLRAHPLENRSDVSNKTELHAENESGRHIVHSAQNLSSRVFRPLKHHLSSLVHNVNLQRRFEGSKKDGNSKCEEDAVPSTDEINEQLPERSLAQAILAKKRSSPRRTKDVLHADLAPEATVDEGVLHAGFVQESISNKPSRWKCICSALIILALFLIIMAVFWKKRQELEPSASSNLHDASLARMSGLSLDLAIEHGKYMRTQAITEDSPNCPCVKEGIPCTNRIGKVYPLTCNTADLSELGPGWVLYFDFMVLVRNLLMGYTLMYLGVFAFYGVGKNIACFADAKLTEEKLVIRDDHVPYWYFSLGNYGPGYWHSRITGCEPETTGVNYPWMGFYHCICALGTVIYAWHYHSKQVKTVEKCHQAVDTPNDFTAIMRNLPSDATDGEILSYCQDLLEGVSLKGGDKPFVGVIRLHDFGNHYETIMKLNTEKKKLDFIRHAIERQDMAQETSKTSESLLEAKEALRSMLTEKETLVEELEKEVRACIPELQVVGALITFVWSQDVARFVQLNQRPGLLGLLPAKLADKYATYQGISLLRFRGQYVLDVDQAPDPSDIIWENQGVSVTYRWRISFVSFVLSLGIVLVSYFVVKYLQIEKRTRTQGSTNQAMKAFYSGFVAMAIIGIFQIQVFTQRFCAALARPTTFTQLKCSQMWRIAFSQVATATAVLFWVHFEWDFLREDTEEGAECRKFENQADGILGHITGFAIVDQVVGKVGCHNWFRMESLVQDVLILAVLQALTAWVQCMEPAMLTLKYLKQWWTKRKLDKGTPTGLTQAELNELFEGPPQELPRRYAHIINVLSYTLSFMPLMPIMGVIGIVGIIFRYIADKYFLLRLAKHPSFHEHDIAFTAIRIVCLCCWPQAALSVILLAPSTREQAELPTMMLVSVVFTGATVMLSLWMWFHQDVASKLNVMDKFNLNVIEQVAAHMDKQENLKLDKTQLEEMAGSKSYFDVKPSFLYKYTKLAPVWDYVPHEVEHRGVDHQVQKPFEPRTPWVRKLASVKAVHAFRNRG